MSEPIGRVNTCAATRAKDRLDRDPTDVRRLKGKLQDWPDLVIVDSERCRESERGEDTSLGQPGQSRALEAQQIGSPVVN